MSEKETIKKRALEWTSDFFDKESREEVLNYIKEDAEELTDAFYKDLEFGTGGMRGIMGPGTNRVNKYTLGVATQALSNYVKSQFSNEEKLKVAIAYDSRHNSKEFSEMIAGVLQSNGIEALLFDDLRPTPELSFAIREYDCQAGIVVTASHNPPEYNGYKVYWSDGGQIVPPHDKALITEVQSLTYSDVRFHEGAPVYTSLGKETDDAYIEALKKQSFSNNGKDSFKLVFTSIHGTSIALMPQTLEALGFLNYKIVDEQANPDGNFPTVKSPNPEESEALSMAVDLANKEGSDMVIGTDPDADRVGIAVRDDKNEMVLLNGNQAATVLIDYLLEQWKLRGKLNGKQFIGRTVVTTELLDKVAQAYGVQTKTCLTGFKWIADLIRQYESELEFVGGGEESYGYMVGSFVRDKDAIGSAALLAEAGAYEKSKGSSFFNRLLDIYVKHGHFHESLVSKTLKGKSGAEKIKNMMDGFRSNPPISLAGEKVTHIVDFDKSLVTNIVESNTTSLHYPKSNVIQLVTEQGSRITARPSGTEPKIKFYFSLNRDLKSKDEYYQSLDILGTKIDKMKLELGI